jgi:SAM-dependent methyltransferase
MQLLEKEIHTENWYRTDAEFNQLFPAAIQQLASQHWTTLTVAKRAANFLAAEPHVRILDIGSGVGKFCLTAAHYKPAAFYYGIEQRKSLVTVADAVKKLIGVTNVTFINGNFTQLDFRQYDHFYFYNSFYENLNGTNKIDDSIDYSQELYHYYNRYLYKQLEQKPAGTRLATFHSMEDEIPSGYHIVGTEMNDLLKFWIKI